MKRQILGLILTAGLFLSSVCPSYAAGDLEGFQEIEATVTPVEKNKEFDELLLEDSVEEKSKAFDEEEMVPVIIVFEADSIIEKDSEAEMDFWNKLQISILESKQNRLREKIEAHVMDGEELEVHYQYTWLLNGIATELPYGLISDIEEMEGVEKVVLQTEYTVCSDISEDRFSEETKQNLEMMRVEGYDGEGTKIAVIDTGIYAEHPSFQALSDEKLTEESMTKDKMKSVVAQLNAFQKYEKYYGSQIEAGDVYKNSKIAYGFDYAGPDTYVDHGDNHDDHGTHVAGIAAANDLKDGGMVGMAPAAQLYVMKVFGAYGGAATENLLAAIEDAMILDADVINMSLGSPSGFSSGGEYLDEIYKKVSETGTILVVAAGNNSSSGDGTNWGTGKSLTDNPDNATINSPATYVNALSVANADCTETETGMSFSSSWGPTPDLRLEPDITAPGTMIYSTRDPEIMWDGSMYGEMSGTSMASPCIAGMAALMVQQMNENTQEIAAEQKFAWINTLLMSTAEPIACEDGYYSPRVQGAGLANIEKALESKTYLSVHGMDVPKVELHDDPKKTGRYQYCFKINNISNKNVYYEAETAVQTELAKEMNGLLFMSGQPKALDADVKIESDGFVKTMDYNSDGKTNTADARYLYLQVQEGKIEEAADAFRYEIDKNSESNVDDVQAYLDALTEKADVNLEEKILEVVPGESVNVSVAIAVTEESKVYMDTNFKNGIYLEGFTFLKGLNKESANLSLPYMGFYGDWTSAPILDDGYYWEEPEESDANFTFNEIYTQKNNYSEWKLGMNPYLEEAFDEKYISISPNEDGSADSVSKIKLSLLRNVKDMQITFKDENERCYHQAEDEKIRKAAIDDYYQYYVNYDMTDENGEYLANNSKISMNIELQLDYDQSEPEVWSVPITIDTEAPRLLQDDGEAGIAVLSDGTKQYIRMKFKDNVGTAAVCLLNEKGKTFTKYLSDHESEEQGEYQYFDITGIGGTFYVVLGDYAFNKASYQIETSDNDYIIDSNTLYGYQISDETSASNESYGWVDISKENAAVRSVEMSSFQNLNAAEYVDGQVIGIDLNNNLTAFEFGKWNERKKSANIPYEIADMAYDPVTKKLYAYSSSDYCVLMIDPVTEEVSVISNGFVESIVAMTCSDTGVLYAITRSGDLTTIDKETGTLNEETLLNTGLEPSKQQSMTYDAEQNCIYWSCFEYRWGYETVKSRLIKIDLDNYEMTDLGTIGGNAQIVGLMMLNERGAGLFDNVELRAVEFDRMEYELLKDETVTAKMSLIPWCAQEDGLVWVSMDPEIAEVTQDGVITGKSGGETKIQILKDEQVLGECDVKVTEIKAELYGFAVSNDETLNNKWVKMNAQAMDAEVLYGESSTKFTAAERVEDVLYACGEDGKLYKMEAASGTVLEVLEVKAEYEQEYHVRDMAYDYSTGNMYGIVQQKEGITTDLVRINLGTDATTLDVIIEDACDEQYNSPIYAIGITTEGTIYFVSEMGNICMYNATYNVIMQMDSMGSTFPKNYVVTITMTYDHENGGFYIIPRSYRSGLSLWYYENTNEKIINLGAIRNLTEWNGLYTVPKEMNN